MKTIKYCPKSHEKISARAINLERWVDMKISYDAEADALYICFRDGKIEESDEVSEGFIVDYDADRKPIALEILDASEVLGGKQEIAVDLSKAGVVKLANSL